jgi:DNA-binding winged helix-turn-helix (wHTH) protein/Tol biopolymer transport system component
MQASVVHFDRFELDLNSYELRESGRPIKLERLPTELLILLAEKPGQLVTREEILQRLWGDNVYVDTRQGINTAVRKIRIALHDDPEHPRLLQTVSGRGYRLLAPPQEAEQPCTESQPKAEAGSKALPRWTVWAGAALLLGLVAAFASRTFLSSRRQTATPPAEKRVTANPPEAPIRYAIVSPDGKYLAYTDSTGLNLRSTASGEIRPWSLPKDLEAYPNSWFPDGIHLLVARFEGPDRVPSLWRLSVLGGSPRKLIDVAEGGAVSPDATRILFVRSNGRSNELWMMDVNGGGARKIAAAGEFAPPNYLSAWIFPVVWSPGGKRIAYIERYEVNAPSPVENRFSLQTRDANGGEPQILSSDARIQPALCWAADGRLIYAFREGLQSERIDDGVQSIRVNEDSGKAVGEPQRIADGTGRIASLSVTNSKQLFLLRMNTQPQVFVTEAAAGTGRWSTPRRLTLDENGSVASAWTTDSKAILFVSNRHGTWKLFKQAIDETAAEVLVEGRSIILPRLSADGTQVLYLAESQPYDTAQPVSLMSLPLSGGPPRVVLREAGITNFQCARSPAKLCLVTTIAGETTLFSAFDIETGLGHETVRTEGGYENWSLSLDGSRLAMVKGDHSIRFLTLATGATHDVVLNEWRLPTVDWSADGKSVTVGTNASDGLPVILQVSVTGKAEVLLQGDRSTIPYWWMIQSPDGRYGAVVADIGENNVWTIENF